MLRTHKWILLLTLIALAGLIGCSDDDDDPVTPPGPDDPSIVSVIISPESSTFTNIGEEQEFDAAAFDAQGAVVDTVFEWQSSNPAIVQVGPGGFAVATGIGNAEIYVSSGGKADTASVVVDVIGAPIFEWIAGEDGDWQDGSKWSEGTAPQADDMAVITVPGDYVVTLTGDVEVLGLQLGSDSGTQTLATGANTLTMDHGGLSGGAALDITGEVYVLQDAVWSGGSVVGTGSLTIERDADFNLLSESLKLEATLVNKGNITLLPGATLQINGGTLENNTGALIDFQGNATISVFSDGVFNSTGTIEKSAGQEEASILTSSATFTTDGTLRVDFGKLWISGGTLKNIIDIAEGAVLRQSGNTAIPSLISRGDGALEIGGRVTFGNLSGESIALKNVILDSSSNPSMAGPANVRIDESFTWRKGTLAELGEFTTMPGAMTRLETTGTKGLSNITWNVINQVEADESLNLFLADNAGIVIEPQGQWTQTNGGTISVGLGGTPDGFHVQGVLNKVGPGAFVVKTPLTCTGTLNLVDGALTVEGDFLLHELGVITGGGIADDVGFNVRLILVAADSAEMRGTIRPDLDGNPARMDIQGLVDLTSTFRVELDIMLSGDILFESLNFITGGQELAGTLAVNVVNFPDPGTEIRVVSTHAGPGMFDHITGEQAFTGVVQDELGVLLTRN
ncbi:MAG: hypothetical protein KAH56_01745 [Candidatus Krumholzibacteria bacterium]|nr:hypothetical protein [Candidatus Krumholzibacteria bacterium]